MTPPQLERWRCGGQTGLGRRLAGWAEIYTDAGLVFCADVGIDWENATNVHGTGGMEQAQHNAGVPLVRE